MTGHLVRTKWLKEQRKREPARKLALWNRRRANTILLIRGGQISNKLEIIGLFFGGGV